MNNFNNNSDEVLRTELASLKAREFEVVALTVDADRGLAALRYAQQRGAEHPIAYAIKMFDNSDWQPSGETRRKATNQSVETKCSTCGGDRFVVHSTRAPQQTGWMKDRGITPSEEPIEEMKPCPDCNPGEIVMWRWDGTRLVTPH